jgi:TerC family integral membrane protein
MEHSIWLWVSFGAFILVMLSIDLGMFNRRAHSVSYKEAALWSTVWISLAAVFAGFIFFHFGKTRGLEFVTGYLIELSLSIDNLFVFILLFAYFKVPDKFQHRVLFWGVLGALLMRISMILIGAELIETFHWINYLFGAFLVYTGLKMLREGETEIEPSSNPIVKLVTRYVPIVHRYEEEKFFTVVDGRRTGTLLLLVLVIVEVTDLLFAVDSIPAIFAVTNDRFILYTSNVFAILGLRSLFFLLAQVIQKFEYLRVGLAVVLAFIGVKMLLGELGIDVPIGLALAGVVSILTLSVLASMIWTKSTGQVVASGTPGRARAVPTKISKKELIEKPELPEGET